MINYQLADLVSRLHVASSKFLNSVLVLYNILNLRFLLLLNVEGVIEGFRVVGHSILVFLKFSYLNLYMVFKNVKILSSPGNRVFWTLPKLSKKYFYSLNLCKIIHKMHRV